MATPTKNGTKDKQQAAPPAPTALEKPAEAKAIQKFDYGDMAGVGTGDIRADQLMVPYVQQLQDLSALVKDRVANAPGANPMAIPGNFVNSVTGEIFDREQGLTVIPIYIDLEWVEWVPIDDGGGLVNKFRPEHEVVSIAKKLSPEFGEHHNPVKQQDGTYANGKNDLVETHLMWALCSADHENWFEAIVPFTSTKIKPFKKAVSAINGFCKSNGVPIFAVQLHLKGRYVNEKPAYWTVDLPPLNGDVRSSILDPSNEGDKMLLDRAWATRKLVESGAAKADDASLEKMRAGGGGKSSAQTGAPPDGDIPF